MRKVRTTKQPWLELEVDDAEYLDLARQGLLLTATSGAEEAPEKPATARKDK